MVHACASPIRRLVLWRAPTVLSVCVEGQDRGIYQSGPITVGSDMRRLHLPHPKFARRQAATCDTGPVPMQALVSNEVRVDLPSALAAAAALQPIPAGPDTQARSLKNTA